jgi:hypothetical protein
VNVDVDVDVDRNENPDSFEVDKPNVAKRISPVVRKHHTLLLHFHFLSSNLLTHNLHSFLYIETTHVYVGNSLQSNFSSAQNYPNSNPTSFSVAMIGDVKHLSMNW